MAPLSVAPSVLVDTEMIELESERTTLPRESRMDTCSPGRIGSPLDCSGTLPVSTTS